VKFEIFVSVLLVMKLKFNDQFILEAIVLFLKDNKNNFGSIV